MIPVPDRKNKNFEICSPFYGLGFSPKDNGFKLLRLQRLCGDHDDFWVAEIYTFGESGAWRNVANCPNLPDWARKPAFYEGIAHWYWANSDHVVTFDFDTEQFGTINPPPLRYMGMGVGRFSRMRVLGGCLHMTDFITGTYLEVWVMEEYGVQSSWKKAISMLGKWYEPVKYLRNGKLIMLNHHQKVVCYDPSTGNVKSIDSCLSICGAISIEPSLVPLKVMLRGYIDVWSATSGSAHDNHIEVATIPL